MPEDKLQLQKIRQNLLAIRRGATPSEMSERMRELCNINGYDPIFELMDMVRSGVKVQAKDSDGNTLTEFVPLDAKELIAIHKEMAKYIYPTLKSVDIQGQIDANVTVQVKQYGVPFQGKQTAVDAEFTPLQEVIAKNVKEVLDQ
jgi:hypothetical protein